MIYCTVLFIDNLYNFLDIVFLRFGLNWKTYITVYVVPDLHISGLTGIGVIIPGISEMNKKELFLEYEKLSKREKRLIHKLYMRPYNQFFPMYIVLRNNINGAVATISASEDRSVPF